MKSQKPREKTRFSRENAIFSVWKSGQSNFIPEYENTKSAEYPGEKYRKKRGDKRVKNPFENNDI